jgi:hypothetical protein
MRRPPLCLTKTLKAQAEPAELIIQPPTMDVRQLGPKVMLHIHLSEDACGFNLIKIMPGNTSSITMIM